MGIVRTIRNFFTGRPDTVGRIQMVTETGEGFYVWDGKMYQSDIIRACIRPKTQAVGKIIGKHIRETATKEGKAISVNPEPYIRYLLSEPNPYMTGQMLQEKLANQLALNGNAFALLIRDENGYVQEIYPIPAVSAEAKYSKDGELFIEFQYMNGKNNTFRYTDILHLRRDYYDRDIFGSSQIEPIKDVMTTIGTIDRGIRKAIKNSGIVKWLLQSQSSMRPEDLKEHVRNFVDNYLNIETETFGAAGVDSKFEATQIKPQDYVPNFQISQQQMDRVKAFFNTNDKIINSSYTEDEWNSYYEAEVEPLVLQFSQVWTRALFTRREQSCGNRIQFEAANLQCASINTKLAMVAMVDRGAMTPNEWRATLNLAPLPGGDEPIRRLDTQVVDMARVLLDRIDGTNYPEICKTVRELIATIEKGEENGEEVMGHAKD